MKKPKDLLEYVVVHEMIHLIEPTHNERFLALLSRHYPGWREARAELNELPLNGNFLARGGEVGYLGGISEALAFAGSSANDPKRTYLKKTLAPFLQGADLAHGCKKSSIRIAVG